MWLVTMVVQRPGWSAPQEDKWRCEEALRVSGRTFTESWITWPGIGQ